MKRVVVISDLHCGHRAGLTPPGWQYQMEGADEERLLFAKTQRAIWNWFQKAIESLKPINALFVNGDCVDGKGAKTGGVEQLESDRIKQVDMAAHIINTIAAEMVVMTYGTAYHTGAEEDWERLVADRVGAVKIGGHEWPEVEGLVFDLKHKVSGSTIPHGRYTALARDAMWNELWANREGQPLADVYIRSHVHYCVWLGAPGKLGVITPALQGWGSKFGTRDCSGIVDIGFISFDVQGKEAYTWKRHIFQPRFVKEKTLPLWKSELPENNTKELCE